MVSDDIDVMKLWCKLKIIDSGASAVDEGVILSILLRAGKACTHDSTKILGSATPAKKRKNHVSVLMTVQSKQTHLKEILNLS